MGHVASHIVRSLASRNRRHEVAIAPVLISCRLGMSSQPRWAVHSTRLMVLCGRVLGRRGDGSTHHPATISVEGLKNGELFRQCAGLHHPLAVISRHALELCTSGEMLESSCCRKRSGSIPVLEPYLDLSWTETRNLSCQTLAMGSIWVSLSCELAHKKAGLVVGKPTSRLASIQPIYSRFNVPKALHLSLFLAPFAERHGLLLTCGLA